MDADVPCTSATPEAEPSGMHTNSGDKAFHVIVHRPEVWSSHAVFGSSRKVRGLQATVVRKENVGFYRRFHGRDRLSGSCP